MNTIPIALQPYFANLSYLILRLVDLGKLIDSIIKGIRTRLQRYWDEKIRICGECLLIIKHEQY